MADLLRHWRGVKGAARRAFVRCPLSRMLRMRCRQRPGGCVLLLGGGPPQGPFDMAVAACRWDGVREPDDQALLFEGRIARPGPDEGAWHVLGVA